MAKKKATKAKGKKTTKAKPAKKRAAPKAAKQPEETMDRKALKEVASQLKAMGADLKVLKSDSDAQLQKKVNDALHAMPAPEVLAKLESVQPDKLVTVLKRDCLGVFVDLSDPSCVRCKDNTQCVKEYLKNLSGGMESLRGAMPAAADADEEVELSYQPKRLVFVLDVKNPEKKGSDFYDVNQKIIDNGVDTMKAIRKIIEEEFEQTDDEFLQTLVALREEGVLKFDFDLTDKDKTELRAAGYSV